MTTDRELLELAAKAAGIVGEWVNYYGSGDYYYKGNTDGIFYCDYSRGGEAIVWNPIADDGDALRLAVGLGITIGPESPDVIGKSLCRASWNNRSWSLGEYGDGDIYAAARRAIVRAAAEIGRTME